MTRLSSLLILLSYCSYTFYWMLNMRIWGYIIWHPQADESAYSHRWSLGQCVGCPKEKLHDSRFWELNACICIFLTPVIAVGTFYTTINPIGPLQLAIHVVQNHHGGEQKSKWNKPTNKGKYHLKISYAILFVLSQCDVCPPAWRFCITWMASSKGPIQSHKPVLALLLVFPHEAYISKPF